MRQKVRKAFTLVEILIVVVILGILAAIVIPQFTSATRQAQGGNMLSQLESINSQVELFRAQYNAYPQDVAADATNPWESDLTPPGRPTIEGGMIGAGLLKEVPRNPINSQFAVATAPAADVGWVWLVRTVNGRTLGQYFAMGLNNDPADNTPDADGVYGEVIIDSAGQPGFKAPTGWAAP